MELPPEQEAIRARCFHPAEVFVEFSKQDTEQSIFERFEKIVQLYSDRLALKDDALSLTYAELNRAANRVAHAIIGECGHEIGPVLVLADHNTAAIVACLGVLKAGKILVAVDPSFPVDRLKATADDSQPQAILTYGHNYDLATKLAGLDASVINVDTLASDVSTKNVGLSRSPLDSAIIRFTSGSTGKPKGVLRNHRKSLDTWRARINASHLCPQDRKIILRRVSFSVTDAFSGLMAGASVFLYDIKKRGLQNLGEFLRTEQITYFVATPSIFRYFAQDLKADEEFPHLRLIQLGGEPLFRSDIENYKKYFPPKCSLLNQFSSSEMGTVCQFWIAKETEIDTPIVPAGYPVEGKKVLLLDDEQNEIGLNETGEIAVASRNLSTGYWNDSGLTNDKFFPSKGFADERVYLSGDLGRMLQNGCLLYIGRKDDQVKIRGAKVEIREIEAVLSEHPQVKQSAVVALNRRNGDKYLTAYLVPRYDPAPTVTDINAYLREKLPDYMIPSAVMCLASLPLVNGKVDRKGLPKPDDKRPELSTPYASARDEIEKTLVQTWEQVLDVRPVGINDNFFDLGGHSLAATRIISRVIRQFAVEVPIQSLFQSPTIADMAAVIAAHQGKSLDGQGLTTVLEELESLSEEDAKRLV